MNELDTLLLEIEANRNSSAYKPCPLVCRQNKDYSISVYRKGKLVHKIKPMWWQNRQDQLNKFLDYHFNGHPKKVRWILK